MDILGLFGISFSFQGILLTLINSILGLVLDLVAGILGVDPIE